MISNKENPVKLHTIVFRVSTYYYFYATYDCFYIRHQAIDFQQLVSRSNDMKYYEKLVESGIGIGIERDNPKSLQTRKIAFLDVADFAEESVVYAYFKKDTAYGNVEDFWEFLKSKDFL